VATWTDVHEVSDHAITIDRAGGIENRLATDSSVGLHYSPSEDDCAFTRLEFRVHECPGINHHRPRHVFVQVNGKTLSRPVIASRNQGMPNL
jgi:hypothetical protein